MSLLLLSTTAMAITPQEAIKSQLGCYAVTFQYSDTRVLHEDYSSQAPKRTEAIEWVHLEEDSESRIVLQHVLVSGPAMIKHWRQEWIYEETSILTFAGDNTWYRIHHAPEDVREMWAQKVYNVDDGPRYECIAPWEISDLSASWTCQAPSPLPRREKMKKGEYDFLERTNTHHIEPQGWVHEQHNTKVRLDDGVPVVLAREYGYNTYERIDDERCQEAIDWWPSQQAAWHTIQAAWLEALSPYEIVEVDERVRGIPLWIRLFSMARRAEKKGHSVEAIYADALKLLRDSVEGEAGPPATTAP